jgi:FixJ family two-component response regulator
MVITDIRMPKLDGLSVAMTIKDEAPQVPITVVTGHGTESMAIEALRAGVTDFLKKPVRLEDLSGALARMETTRQLVTPHEQRGMPASVEEVERVWKYRLNNELEVIPEFVDGLLGQVASGMAPQAITELNIALRELIVNAMEHGNLGLSFEDKSLALEEGTLPKLLQQRAAQPLYADRQVTITASRLKEAVSVQIADMGGGFDWHEFAESTDPKHLLSSHGRGVLLARMSVNALTFNDKGNQVTVTKAL